MSRFYGKWKYIEYVPEGISLNGREFLITPENGDASGKDDIALVAHEKDARLIAAAPELYWMVYNLLFELKHGNGSNPEYVKQAILQMEELLKRIQGTVEKPKPCPFCGGTPYIASDKNNLTAAVKCPLCGATIRVFSKDGDTASAISAWNRREQ